MRIKQNSVTSIIFWHIAIQDLEGTSNDQNASQGKVYPLSTYCINWIIQKKWQSIWVILIIVTLTIIINLYTIPPYYHKSSYKITIPIL